MEVSEYQLPFRQVRVCIGGEVQLFNSGRVSDLNVIHGLHSQIAAQCSSYPRSMNLFTRPKRQTTLPSCRNSPMTSGSNLRACCKASRSVDASSSPAIRTEPKGAASYTEYRTCRQSDRENASEGHDRQAPLTFSIGTHRLQGQCGIQLGEFVMCASGLEASCRLCRSTLHLLPMSEILDSIQIHHAPTR